MTGCYFLFVLIGAVSIGCISGAEFMKTKADFVETCKINDPNFMSCSTRSINKLYKQASIGIEGLESFQFDPMKFKEVRVSGEHGLIKVNSTLTDVSAIGFAGADVTENIVNPSDYSWVTKLHLPKLRIEGNYQSQAQILFIPVVGSGTCWCEASGLNVTIYSKMRLYEKFRRTFFDITGAKVDFAMSGFKVHLYNLFDGISVLEYATNYYLNSNWEEIAETFKPIVARTIEDNFVAAINRIYNYIPADYLISDLRNSSELLKSTTEIQ